MSKIVIFLTCLIALLLPFHIFAEPIKAQTGTISTCDIVEKIEPEDPGIGDEVKLMLKSDRTTREYRVRVKGGDSLVKEFSIGSLQKELSLESFGKAGLLMIEIYESIFNPTLCNDTLSFNIADHGNCSVELEYSPTIPDACYFKKITSNCKPDYAPALRGSGCAIYCTCVPATSSEALPSEPPPCTAEEDIKSGKCTLAGGKQCGTDANPAIATAIGCIHTSPAGFVKDMMRFVIAISGGLAFLMMLLGAFQMLTSAGNPETLAAGKDRLQSAVIGLLIIIFATLLLKIIGVDILGIRGFG